MYALILAGLALLASTPAGATAPAFARAYLEAGSVCFAPDESLAWRALARKQLAFDPERPPPRALAEGWSEVGRTATVRYEAPLPSGLASVPTYLLSEAGVAPLALDHLRGEVVYDLDRPDATPGPPRFGGSLCAHAPAGLTDAGFVVRGGGPWSVVERGLPRSGGKQEAPLRNAPLRAAYLLAGDAGRLRYLFVRWQPDRACAQGCCVFRYDLYALPARSPLLANDYECDL